MTPEVPSRPPGCRNQYTPGLPRLLVLRLVSSTTHKNLLNASAHGAHSPLPSVTGQACLGWE